MEERGIAPIMTHVGYDRILYWWGIGVPGGRLDAGQRQPGWGRTARAGCACGQRFSPRGLRAGCGSLPLHDGHEVSDRASKSCDRGDSDCKKRKSPPNGQCAAGPAGRGKAEAGMVQMRVAFTPETVVYRVDRLSRDERGMNLCAVEWNRLMRRGSTPIAGPR